MANFSKVALLTLLALTSGACCSSLCAQPADPDGIQRKLTGKYLELRIRKQREHIEKQVSEGTLEKDQAGQLKNSLDAMAAEIEVDRTRNGGVLKPNEARDLQNRLNASRDVLQTKAGANKHVDDGPNPLGPGWTQGRDGGENAEKLKAEMRQEEKRELRQEKQNSAEQIEKQQIQYEQEALQALSKDKDSIVKGKSDLQTIRQDNGN
ncbi:MAG: hypothetical protein KGS72_19060 [Cyanobacteria bacterium REEB67]|nr:hypothetical protein [Cyanobacteria bacterium REEB67]